MGKSRGKTNPEVAAAYNEYSSFESSFEDFLMTIDDRLNENVGSTDDHVLNMAAIPVVDVLSDRATTMADIVS